MRDILRVFGHSHAMHAGVACGSTVLRTLSCAMQMHSDSRQANMYVCAAKIETAIVNFKCQDHHSRSWILQKINYCCASICVAPHKHACMLNLMLCT